MPKYNSVISRAVDMVARKLAGMDNETVSQFTRILSEEAEKISEELHDSGQDVNPDVLAARLDGFIARMRHALRDTGPDTSPYEFPIFNVSHDPSAPYPNPINYLYDKEYREVYPNSILRSQPIFITFEQKPTPIITTNLSASSSSLYPQQQQNIVWYSATPHVTYDEQPKKPVEKLRSRTPHRSHRSHRSSPTSNSQARSLSRSTNYDESKYPLNSKTQQILVNVIHDDASSISKTNSQGDTLSPVRTKSHKSILKSTKSGNNKLYTTTDTVIGTETIEDLFQAVKSQPSVPSQFKSSTEHVVIIDQHDSKSSDSKHTRTKRGRLHTSKTQTTITSTATNVVATTPSTTYAVQQPTYYSSQPAIYRPAEMYTSMPSINYSTTPYVSDARSYYPFVFYQY